MAINLHLSWFFLNCGWYPGDPFKLLSITFFETMEGYPSGKIDQVTFFNFQMLYFSFLFGWQQAA